MSSDHSDEDLIAEPNPLGNITAMAIDPSDSKTLYVAAGDRKKEAFALFISRDGGQNCVREENLPGRAYKMWDNSHSPSGARMGLIAGSHFLEEQPSFG